MHTSTTNTVFVTLLYICAHVVALPSDSFLASDNVLIPLSFVKAYITHKMYVHINYNQYLIYACNTTFTLTLML